MQFTAPPVILASASVVGKKEGEGPLRDRFAVSYTHLTLPTIA